MSKFTFYGAVLSCCVLIGHPLFGQTDLPDSFPTQDMIASYIEFSLKNDKSFLDDLQVSNMRHSLVRSLPFSDLEKLRTDSKLSEQLMLVPAQSQKLRELWDAQKIRLEELDEKIKVAKKERAEKEKNGPVKRAPWEPEDSTVEDLISEKDEVRREILTEFVKELQPDQIRQLANLDFQTFGIVNFMTCDIVAENLDLTDEQRKKIAKNSEKIGKELQEYLLKTRQDFHDAIFSELSETQLERLNKIAPQEDLDRFFEELTFGKLQDEFMLINVAPSKLKKRK